MLVLGIFITILCIVALIAIGINSDDSESVAASFLVSLCFCMGVILIIGYVIKDDPIKKSTKDNILKVQVNITTKNGIETDRDTIYIFTPKK